MFSGGVGQVESTSCDVGPTHELDRDLVASGLDKLFHLQTQTAVLHCCTAQSATGEYMGHAGQKGFWLVTQAWKV